MCTLKDITMHLKIAKPIHSRLHQIQSQLFLFEMLLRRDFLSALKVYGENKKRSQTETGGCLSSELVSALQYNESTTCYNSTTKAQHVKTAQQQQNIAQRCTVQQQCALPRRDVAHVAHCKTKRQRQRQCMRLPRHDIAHCCCLQWR